VLHLFGNGTISEIHGPVQVRLGDVAGAEEMLELCHISLHKTFGSFPPAFLFLVFLLH